MLQRIQSVWYLIAALALGLTFVFDIYQQSTVPNIPNLTLGNDVIGIILVAVSILLTLYTLFLFKSRKRQITFTWLSMLLAIGSFGYLYFASGQFVSAHSITEGHFWIGLFMPLIAVIFLFMALAGVRKDQKLIKSLDRLR